MSDVLGVSAKVQAYLTSQGPVEIDDRGRYSFEIGSTRTFIEVLPHGDEEATLVMVTVPILFGVTLTPELYRYVAVHSDDWIFGHLFLVEAEDGTGTVFLRHMLLGDYLDKDELLYAVFGLSAAGDGLDDELRPKFGGRRYADG